MQMAVIEHARNVAGLKDANSTEMEEDCPTPVISIMEEQKHIEDKGGTMRLGAWKCQLEKDSLAYNVYQSEAMKNAIATVMNLMMLIVKRSKSTA